jgi:diguanylate cyclase (GGDEF)-like protein/PAS domain S-box-containing protein
MSHVLEGQEAVGTAKPLILIVDDVAANLHVLSAELRALYRIKVARDGRKALSIARDAEDPPDLVLLDVMMPGLSGHDVLRQLRDDSSTSDIPVILVTADTTDGSEELGLVLGAGDYLSKPVDIPVMRARVKNLVTQRLLQREIVRSQLKLQAMLDSSMQFIALLDLSGRLLHMNRPVREVMGLNDQELPEPAFWQVPPWRDTPSLAARLQQAIEHASVGIPSQFECSFERDDGTCVMVDASLGPVRGLKGETTFVLFEARDITNQKKAENSIRVLVNSDAITGLANRNLLAERVQHALSAHPDSPLALVRVEMGRLTEINEAYGQDASDEALREMARRISGSIRQSDTVARLEGGSFALLLPGADAAGAAAVAQKLVAALVPQHIIQGTSMPLQATVGVALAPADGTTFGSLLMCADVAVSRTRLQGGEEVRFFAAKMQAGLTRKLRMESLLRQAVARKELQLHYQPQINLVSGACIGVEALLRWTSAELGPVPPLDFIGLAETSGLINELGTWVLREAIAQGCRWRDAGIVMPSVAVNLSAIQLQQPDIVETILQCLREAGLPAHYLEIELTESAAFMDPDLALNRIEAMRRSGLRLAIDDFGTGFSSLSYLQRIRVDKLKIDRAFVHQLGEGGDDETLMESMLAMARALKISVLAEGVETEVQLTWLRNNGCHAVQGYHFSRPLPAAAVADWLAGHQAGL